MRWQDGLYVFVGWLYKLGSWHLHCMAYNAGTSILYLVPYVVLVQESDKANLDLFAARMRLYYGRIASAVEPPFQ